MRRSGVVLLSLALIAGVSSAAQVDPAAALAEAKVKVVAKRYAEAVKLLEPALGSTAGIADQEQRKQARTALHFYMAVAQSGLGREEAALSHLREALELAPNMRNIDTSRYDPAFVSLFTRARYESGGSGRFDELYPGFRDVVDTANPDVPTMWEEPAVEILGTKQEKRAWNETKAPGERARFLDAFWLERDRTPGTAANEFRETFGRRVAFADKVFDQPGERGAMTDRGKVFAVLGAPSRVQRRALSAQDLKGLTAMSVGGIGIEVGTVEYWFYTKEELPVAFPAPTATFRFVTHQGIGQYVMQRDGLPVNLLNTAIAAPRE